MRIDNETLITSSGIIRNKSKPRVGITNVNNLHDDFYQDCLNNGIDLTWEEYDDEMNRRIENAEISIDDAQDEMECVEFDSHTFLLGAWIKVDGRYEIDRSGKSGSFALQYDTGSGYVSVEWSQVTKQCQNTSPCFVMANGDGPCGNLDSEGSEVIAYTLPVDFFRTNGI